MNCLIRNLVWLGVAGAFIAADAKYVTITEKTFVVPSKSHLITCHSEQEFNSCSWKLPSNVTCDALAVGQSTQCRKEPSVHINRTDTTCSIAIPSVKREHSGIWTCSLTFSGEEEDENVGEAQTEVDVFEEGKLDWDQIYGILTVIAGAQYNLTCKAPHSRPVGDFSWTFSSEEENKTSPFPMFPTHKTITETETSQPGLFNVEETMFFTPTRNLDGWKIYCSYSQFDFQQRLLSKNEVDIDLKVHFLEITPNIPIEDKVELGASYNLSATIFSNPAPVISWRIINAQTNEIVDSDEQSIKHNIVTRQKDDASHEYITTMMINSVSQTDIENKYFVRASVSEATLWTEELEIKLFSTEEVDEVDNSNTTQIIGIIILCIIGLLIILFTVFYLRAHKKLCWKKKDEDISPDTQEHTEPLQESAASIIKHHPYSRP